MGNVTVGTILTIKGSPVKMMNGKWEIYNITDFAPGGMYHMARVGKDGKKLPPNEKNLVNPNKRQLELMFQMGMIQE